MLVNNRVLKSIRPLMAAFVLVFVLMVVVVPSSFAQSNSTQSNSTQSSSNSQSTTNTANTLKLSPVRTDIQIKKGESGKVDITVTNLTNNKILVRPIENDFIQGDENGTPSLILDANEYAPTHSLKRFMAPLADVEIPAKSSKVISVTITVPASAQSGGYFGALRFAPTTPDSGGQVNLSASAASLILLTVPGPVTEQLNLTNFVIQQAGKEGSDFRTPNDLQVSFRFENKGNIQIGPFGKISVKKGDKVVYEVNFNEKTPRDVILPDGARKWDIPLDKIESFGHYTVSATFTYGSKNQSIDVERSFWVIPTTYIIGAIVALVLLLGLIAWLVYYLKGRKRRLARRGGRRRR